METGAFVDAIRSDLQAMTAGDEAAAAVAERLSRALESSLQLRLLDAMGQAAVEISSQLSCGHVEVRLAGRDVELVLVETTEAGAPPAPDDDEGGTARLTLRMSDALKVRVEEAADRAGLSANAWLVRTVARGLDSSNGHRRRGGRITRFAQS